jgi:hypothetical protein
MLITSGIVPMDFMTLSPMDLKLPWPGLKAGPPGPTYLAIYCYETVMGSTRIGWRIRNFNPYYSTPEARLSLSQIEVHFKFVLSHDSLGKAKNAQACVPGRDQGWRGYLDV